MAAECGAAFLHFSFAALALGFKDALFVLPASLIFRELGNGPVRFYDDVADSFPIAHDSIRIVSVGAEIFLIPN
jgi:hypothetical protein